MPMLRSDMALRGRVALRHLAPRAAPRAASRLLLGAALACVACAAQADDAPTVSVGFVNNTQRSFDYSLQMASLKRPWYDIIDVVTLGKNSVYAITNQPIIGPGQHGGWTRYTYNTRFWTTDGISLNLQLPTTERYGMRAWPVVAPHTCNIPSSMDGGYVLLNLHEDRLGILLYEQFSDGDVCSFDMTPDYGPAFQGTRGEPRQLPDPFGDPELLRQLDAEFERATGINPAAARARAKPPAT